MLIQYWVAQRYEKNLTLPNYESINLRPTSKKTAKLPLIDVNTPESSGLAYVKNEDLTITLNGRQLTIVSPQATQLQIASIDGNTHTINVGQGLTTYNVPRAGFYIINGQKMIVK
jgi:hypothetical protein